MSDEQSIQKGTQAPPTTQGGPAIEFPKEGAFWPTLVAFLSTPAGAAMNAKLAEWIGALKEVHKQKHVVLVNTVSRYLLMAGIMAAAVWLQSSSRLDSAITGLLGLALGYLFGRQRSQD